MSRYRDALEMSSALSDRHHWAAVLLVLLVLSGTKAPGREPTAPDMFGFRPDMTREAWISHVASMGDRAVEVTIHRDDDGFFSSLVCIFRQSLPLEDRQRACQHRDGVKLDLLEKIVAVFTRAGTPIMAQMWLEFIPNRPRLGYLVPSQADGLVREIIEKNGTPDGHETTGLATAPHLSPQCVDVWVWKTNSSTVFRVLTKNVCNLSNGVHVSYGLTFVMDPGRASSLDVEPYTTALGPLIERLSYEAVPAEIP